MAEGRNKTMWQHTSAMLCLAANVARDPKKSRPFRPADFDPYAAKAKRIPMSKADVIRKLGMSDGKKQREGNPSG